MQKEAKQHFGGFQGKNAFKCQDIYCALGSECCVVLFLFSLSLSYPDSALTLLSVSFRYESGQK